MATASLTRVRGYFYKGYNVTQASSSGDQWTQNIGHVSTDLYNEKEYAAACYEFTVPTISGSPHAMVVSFGITLTSHGYINAVVSTTPPIYNGVITNWRYGPTSGRISNVGSYTSSQSSISLTINDSAAISGSTIYLYLYQTADGFGPYIYNGYYTVSGMPTASLSYHVKHTLSISAGIGSTISVYRGTTTYGTVGYVNNGNTIYDGDVLTISASPNINYRVTSLTVNGSNFTSGGTHSVSGNVTVVSDAQALASDIGATNADIGSVSTITITKYDQTYYHSIQFSFEGVSGYVASNGQVSQSEVKFTNTSVAFTVPSTFFAAIPSAISGTCTLTCRTYATSSSTTVLGTATTCTFVATAPQSTCAPVVTGTVQDTNSKTAYMTGNSAIIVRYLSTALATISATARNGSTVTSKSINGSTPTNDTVTVSGDNLFEAAFVFSATDSRGYTTSLSVTPSMVQYIKLTANPEFFRPTPTSGEISLSFSGNFFNGNFGSQSNQLALCYRYRESNDPAFGNWVEIPAANIAKGSTGYYSAISGVQGAIPLSTYGGSTTGFDYKKSYVFEFMACDGYNPFASSDYRLSSVTQTVTVNEGVPVFDWGKNDFKFNVDVIVDGKIDADSIKLGNTSLNESGLQKVLSDKYAVGDIFITTRSGNPLTLLGYGTWSQIKDRFLLAAGDTYTAGNTGGEATHTLTTDELPSHTHGSKTLTGTMNPLAWASSATESGIVSGTQQHTDRVGNSGSNWGDRKYTIDATHEHDSVGSGNSHNNMPPYLVVYMWVRTA